MDKSTREFISNISSALHNTVIPPEAQEQIANSIAQTKIWKAEASAAKAKDDALTHPSQKYKNLSDNYPDIQKDLKEMLPSLVESLHFDDLNISDLGQIPEGKQELETLHELAMEKKFELDSKVNALLLSGISDEYWDALREREKVENALKIYEEQLCAIDKQGEEA